MKDFEGKIAVVTGAASGIGKALVETFVDAGMKVVLADIEKDKLEKTARTLKNAGADVISVTMDVSQADQVEALAQKTIDTYGKVHVLCNNAGVGYGGPNSWETPLEAWQWVLGVNVMGVVHGVHTFMPIMLQQNTEAHIVNTASIAGLVNNLINPSYGVSKHAVVSFSESMYLDLQTHQSKIGLSVLCPGPINTDIMHSSKRNRPDYVPPLPEQTEQQVLFTRVYETWLERGMPPKVVAKQVIDAIREKRFYVITHDFNNAVEQRFRNIIDKQNPEMMRLPPDFQDIMQELMNKA
ncbi:MAG: SDR family NAD(P)-dependent oxidoreductase [Deltaproteobacteria bacterium]|jgi:NAD(P)-dependent dehydrogenase (short-subunit alcohol dehydrogenase family)|nr:SDR family NAD(P)-dependent oxidoreductase [Deltaproteobacteria bacterium]